MSREKPRGGPSTVDKDEGAVVPQQGQLFLLLDQEALEQERRIKPWTIEFGNVHADPELVRLDFDQHGPGSDLEKPRFRLPHRQFSSVNFMRGKAVYASARAATLLPRDRNPEYLREQPGVRDASAATPAGRPSSHASAAKPWRRPSRWPPTRTGGRTDS